jgi:hypothetical protein
MNELLERAYRLGYRDIQFSNGRYTFKVGGRPLSCDSVSTDAAPDRAL